MTAFTQFWHRARSDAIAGALADWRDESAAVRTAYERWARAAREDADLAYAVYAAALEREERASSVYAELVRDAGAAAADPITQSA